MTVTPSRPFSFGRSSPVLAYWLLRSEGFRVRGRRLRGVVSDVRAASNDRAHSLVVRRRLGRSVVLPAEAVEQVVPALELLVVAEDREASRLGARARGAGRAAAASGSRAARTSGTAGLRLVRVGAVASAEAARASAPHVRRAGSAAAHASYRGGVACARLSARAGSACARAAGRAAVVLVDSLARASAVAVPLVRRFATRAAASSASALAALHRRVDEWIDGRRQRA